MIKINMNVIKTGELMIINVLFPGSFVIVVTDVEPVDELDIEDSEFRYSVRDRNAFKADSSPASRGSRICATVS